MSAEAHPNTCTCAFCDPDMEKFGKCQRPDCLDREQRLQALEDALKGVVNMLGPEHFSGELPGLIAEGNEALRVARAALASVESEEGKS